MWWRRKRPRYPSGRGLEEARQPERLQRTLVAISLERAERGGDGDTWIVLVVLVAIIGSAATYYLTGGF